MEITDTYDLLQHFAKHSRRCQNALLRLCYAGDVVGSKLSWIFLGDSIILMFLIVDPYPSIITFTPPPLFFSPFTFYRTTLYERKDRDRSYLIRGHFH